MKSPQEYRAEVLKVSGFGLMAPIGTLLISIAIDNVKIFSLKTFLAFIFFAFLFYIGAIIIVRGLEILEGEN